MTLTLSRKEAARKLLEEENDPGKRLEMILVAELAAKLVDELRSHRENFTVTFVTLKSSVGFFASEKADEHSLRAHLLITYGGKKYFVHLDGLVAAGVARDVVATLVKETLEGCSKELGEEGNAVAARAYLMGTELHKKVELEMFRNALLKPVGVGYATQKLPLDAQGGTGRVQDWLKPVARYLKAIGVEQGRFDTILLEVLGNVECLVSLEKMVAVAAAHDGNIEEYKAAMQKLLPHALELHFADKSRPLQAENLLWLGKHCLWPQELTLAEVLVNGSNADALISLIANGRISLAFQHLLLFNRKRNSGWAAERVQGLIPAAFLLAMSNTQYGIAAALTQLYPDCVSEQETLKAFNSAIGNGQRIALEYRDIALPAY